MKQMHIKQKMGIFHRKQKDYILHHIQIDGEVYQKEDGEGHGYIYNQNNPLEFYLMGNNYIFKRYYSNRIYQADDLSILGQNENRWGEPIEGTYNGQYGDGHFDESDIWDIPTGKFEIVDLSENYSISNVYLDSDWMSFFELEDGETLNWVGGNNYELSDEAHMVNTNYFGRCLNQYAPGGYNYIYITNLFDDIPDINVVDSNGNIVDVISSDFYNREYKNGMYSP